MKIFLIHLISRIKKSGASALAALNSAGKLLAPKWTTRNAVSFLENESRWKDETPEPAAAVADDDGLASPLAVVAHSLLSSLVEQLLGRPTSTGVTYGARWNAHPSSQPQARRKYDLPILGTSGFSLSLSSDGGVAPNWGCWLHTLDKGAPQIILHSALHAKTSAARTEPSLSRSVDAVVCPWQGTSYFPYKAGVVPCRPKPDDFVNPVGAMIVLISRTFVDGGGRSAATAAAADDADVAVLIRSLDDAWEG